MRTIVDLRESQIDALRLLSEQEQISRAELVRRAIDEYLARHQQQPSSSLAFGGVEITWMDVMAGVSDGEEDTVRHFLSCFTQIAIDKNIAEISV